MQLYTVAEWRMSQREFLRFIPLVLGTAIPANFFGGRLVRLMGLLPFTLTATASHMLFWIGVCISRRAATVGALIGCLGGARTLAAAPMFQAEGAAVGMPQGQLSGDRASLFAILKVVGPQLFGRLFLVGQKMGQPAAPFMLNVVLMAMAMVLAQLAL